MNKQPRSSPDRICFSCLDWEEAKGIPGFWRRSQSLFLVANSSIKPYIPRIWRNLLDFLTLKRHANKFRANPVLSVAKERKATIVITATHANSIPFAIKRDSGGNHQIQLPRFDQNAARWLPQTEKIRLEFGFWIDSAKQHFHATAQNWHEYALICAPGTFYDFACIDLVWHR